MKILLIEPDRQLGAIFQSALEAAGHEVQLCRQAQTAIGQVDSALPELIVLELALPRHNGLEFLYELRSYPEWQSVPVVILSSQLISQPMSAWQALGVASYLYKPQTSLKKLLMVVDDVAAATDPAAA